MTVRVGTIGTGIMGRRMLAAMTRHPEFDPAWASDPSAAAREVVSAEFPDVEFVEDVFAQPADLFYIATPPSTHAGLARRARRAVLCEKPLAVDVSEGRQLAADIEIPNAVNFPFATDASVTALENGLHEGRHGETLRVEIRLFFNDWPRKWQRGAASWLAFPEEGGYLREVFSHFAYLTDRLLGPVELADATVERGATGTETSVRATLRAGEVPIFLTGDVGGRAPDFNEWTLYGTETSYRLQDWRLLSIGDDDGWRESTPDASPGDGLQRQLDAVREMLEGRPNPLPTFADALRVQELVEAILRAE
jgi:1,5-anhydro-D-fructose reductase (1,5-anhydro-D-mannitol-forming)